MFNLRECYRKSILFERSAKGLMTATTKFTVKLSHSELQLLAALASDQLFRREFLDSQLPGYQLDRAELNMGKQLVERLRLIGGGKSRGSSRGAGTQATPQGVASGIERPKSSWTTR
jgi:hypothetical protein